MDDRNHSQSYGGATVGTRHTFHIGIEAALVCGSGGGGGGGVTRLG